MCMRTCMRIYRLLLVGKKGINMYIFMFAMCVTSLLATHVDTLPPHLLHLAIQVDLVRRTMKQKVPCMTIEEVQRLGALDPVNVAIDENDPCLSLEKNEDGPEILRIINKLKIADEDIGLDDDGLFGLRPTDRDRGMQLFRGGNVVVESVKLRSGTLRSPDRTPVWIVSGDVVASQRGRVYRVTVVFNKTTGVALDKPAGSCECVAHLGWCSHQLALGFLFTNFLKLFPEDTTCDIFRKVYPPSPFLAQREGCLWSHAVGDATKESTKCFDKLKWKTRKPPKNMRDHGQLLVPRVKAWKEKWSATVQTRNQQHSFARDEVGRGVGRVIGGAM